MRRTRLASVPAAALLLLLGSAAALAESHEAAAAQMRTGVSRQLAFYGSTPAYRPVLELHGWGELQTELNAHLGSAFSTEPVLTQSAYFRSHNRDDQLRGLYLVGAGTHPGAGIPGVVASAKATASLVLEDFAQVEAVAAAAALATRDIFERDGIVEHGAKMVPAFQEALFSCQEFPVVTDVRGYGLLGGIDLAPLDAPGGRSLAMVRALYQAGVMVKMTGDTVLVAPPLVVEESDIDEIFTKIRGVLKAQ